jgi:hypothetical protein
LVKHLKPPVRPLKGGNTWAWDPNERWVRIYHRDDLLPSGDTQRAFGPRDRFDHHTPPPTAPAIDPDGRKVLYAAKTLRTSGGEVFGDVGEATICPHYYAAAIRPARRIIVQDVQGNGSMLIGALPALGSADIDRVETQAWARAIYEDRPASRDVTGVRYTGAHDEGPCVALWETSPPLVVVEDLPLCDPGLFRRFATAMSELKIQSYVVASSGCRRCRDALGRGHPC